MARTPAIFDKNLFQPDKPLAVACSGGADSMALTLLLSAWARENNTPLVALTVDHGLRAESAAEAKTVGKWLAKKNIKHVILTWAGDKPKSNIQEEARKARYRLMAEYCKTNKISQLALAHHREDQAETFLLRLARGSGVDGLSCMLPVTLLYGITLVRPLLDTPKHALIAYLQQQKQEFISDPSNHNLAYDRVKIRNSLPSLAKLGLTTERLASTASAMARAREFLEAETETMMNETCELHLAGYVLFSPVAMQDEITLRILASLVMAIAGHEVRPRLEELQRLQRALYAKSFKGATLAGCEFIFHKGKIIICREPHAVAPPVAASACEWDKRFAIRCNAGKGWTVGALTQKGWLSLAREHGLTNPFPNKKILYTLPALRDAKGMVRAAVHLGVEEKGVTCDVQFTAAWRWRKIVSEDQ